MLAEQASRSTGSSISRARSLCIIRKLGGSNQGKGANMSRILIVDDQVETFLSDVNTTFASGDRGFQFLGLERFHAGQLKQKLEDRPDGP
jgi:hypothetical protein